MHIYIRSTQGDDVVALRRVSASSARLPYRMREGGDAGGGKFIHLVSTRGQNNPRRLRLPVDGDFIRGRFHDFARAFASTASAAFSHQCFSNRIFHDFLSFFCLPLSFSHITHTHTFLLFLSLSSSFSLSARYIKTNWKGVGGNNGKPRPVSKDSISLES